jgi:hypothetical protein
MKKLRVIRARVRVDVHSSIPQSHHSNVQQSVLLEPTELLALVVVPEGYDDPSRLVPPV